MGADGRGGDRRELGRGQRRGKRGGGTDEMRMRLAYKAGPQRGMDMLVFPGWLRVTTLVRKSRV